MNYLKQIIRRVIAGAGDTHRAKLRILQERLEACSRIAASDLAGQRRNGGAEIIDFKK
jgi:hypothetical protein